MKIWTNYEGCEYVIPGKRYEVVEYIPGWAGRASAYVHLEPDMNGGRPLDTVLLEDCMHLNGHDWYVEED